MDENKRTKLKGMGYKIQGCCGMCEHMIRRPYSRWGTCAIHEYKHLKHTETVRILSINIFGSCKDFEISESELIQLEKYSEFL